MKYRREIDGLRALAVLPVILFHAGVPFFGGGFIGVDIFFVISGFLITNIIASELELGRFSVVKFYERRARRILPALFLVMACTLPFAWSWMPPPDLKSFSQSLIAVSVFCSNILFYATSGYFDISADIKPLLHTWSLAVEEQYYVFFPLILLLTWRLGRRAVFVLLAAMAAISVLAAQHFARSHPSFTFYMLPTRGFEILIGALISFRGDPPADARRAAAAAREAAAALGLGMIVLSVIAFNKNTPSPSLYSLVPTVGAALIILFAHEDNSVGRILGNRLLVGIGLISYSLYLWHQPILAFARLRFGYDLSYPSLAILLADAFILAYLSWKYVETPFRDRQKFNAKFIFGAGLLLTLAFVSVGVVGWKENGFPQRFGGKLNSVLAENSPLTNIARIDNGWCFYSIDSVKSLRVGAAGTECMLGAKTHPELRGALFGDSFAGSYEPLWDYVGRAGGLQITSITTNWCYPAFTEDAFAPQSSKAYPQCRFDRKYLAENLKKFDFIIIGGMWSEVLKRNKLQQVLSLISVLSKNVKTVIIMPSPKQYDHSPFLDYQRHLMFGAPFDISALGSSDDVFARRANAELKKAAGAYPNVVFLDRSTLFGGRELSDAGIPYTADGTHVSIYGAERIARDFVKTPEYTDLMRRLADEPGARGPERSRPGPARASE